MSFCSNCGKEHIEGSKFCSYCGTTVMTIGEIATIDSPKQQENNNATEIPKAVNATPFKPNKPRFAIILLILIPVMGVVIIISQHEGKSYNSVEQFRNAPLEETDNFVTTKLRKAGIENVDQDAMVYIKVSLVTRDVNSYFKRIYETTNYEDYIDKAIPTLYFSFNRSLYESSPLEYKEAAKRLITDNYDYPYSKGKDHFGEYLNECLLNKSLDIWIFGNTWKNYNTKTFSFKKATLATLFVRDKIKFVDFKTFPKDEQSDILRRYVSLSFVLNGKNQDYAEQASQSLSDYWDNLNRDNFYSSKEAKDLSDSSTLLEITRSLGIYHSNRK